jgi:hypothetical protein
MAYVNTVSVCVMVLVRAEAVLVKVIVVLGVTVLHQC